MVTDLASWDLALRGIVSSPEEFCVSVLLQPC